jgi:putative nucleotidyltransferase with HDIG domain
MKSRSFNDQLNRVFLMRLMVAGLLVIIMAVTLHFLSLAFYEKYVMDHVKLELTQLIRQTEMLEKAMNQQLQRKAATEADKVFQSLGSVDVPFETSVLYRVINTKNQVMLSNYETGIPKPFVPNASLYQSNFGTVDQFNQAYLKNLRIALIEDDSVMYPLSILNPYDKGNFVFYKSYEKQLIIEILASRLVEKEHVRAFFHEQLDRLFLSENLENLMVTSVNGAVYSKGIQVNHLQKNSQYSKPYSATHALSYGNQPLSVHYSIGNGASDVIQVEYIFWVVVSYGLGALGVFILLKRSSQAVLDPIDIFLNSANEARMGYYDKRLDFLGYTGFKPLSVGFNAMLDRMEKLLEEKKVQEDHLRQLHLTEQQQEETENIGLEEAISVEVRLKQAVLHSETLYTQLMTTLCSAIEAKDQYTHGHCERVLALSIQLAELYGLRDQDLEDIKMGALLHDVGKLGLPEELLNKVDPLTDYEWSVLRRHTRYGEEILADFNVSDATKKIVAMHHEQYDGKGYPNGEIGQMIPIGARIVCLVDAYDAMSNSRPYRLMPMRLDEVVKELISQSAKQFDPELVEMLIQMIGYQGDVADEI